MIESWQLIKKTMELLIKSLKVTRYRCYIMWKQQGKYINIAFDLVEENLLHPVHLPGGVGQGPAGDGDHLHHRYELLPSVMLWPRGVTEWESLARGETCWQSVQCQDLFQKINLKLWVSKFSHCEKSCKRKVQSTYLRFPCMRTWGVKSMSGVI